MVPVELLPPVTPFTFQVTDVFDVFCTVAVNCLVRPTRTLAVSGEMVMLTGGGGGGCAVMVTVAEPTAAPTTALVAWTVTVAGEGTDGGAV